MISSICNLQGDESGEWPSETKTGFPNPENSTQDTITLFHGHRTSGILQQYGVVTTKQEVEPVKLKVTTDDHLIEVGKGMEEKPKVLSMGVGNSQRRAVAMKVGLVHAEVVTTLKEISFARAELKHLNLQIQQLNQVLKVTSSTML